jgi:hypothetical protein
MGATPTVYKLNGATDNGTFLNSDFGGVDVSTWLAVEPLLGNFFEFNYVPSAIGVGMNSQIELDVYALSPSGAPTVPLPASAISGALGLGMLGAYRWRRGRQMKRNG